MLIYSFSSFSAPFIRALKYQTRPLHFITGMSKVPIDTLPVELRIKIYELGDVSRIHDDYAFPWTRTMIMSGILNDKDAIEIAAIQGVGDTRGSYVVSLLIREIFQ